MSANDGPIVHADGVEKYFGRNHVLRSVSLEVRRGEVVCIIGTYGSGKTNFLRRINHPRRIGAGRVAVTRTRRGNSRRASRKRREASDAHTSARPDE